MKNYEIEQSKAVIGKQYSKLIDQLNFHIKLLALNRQPFTSAVAIKRGLHRLRIDYLPSVDSAIKGIKKLSESEELLASEVLEKFNTDIKEAIEIGLVGEKEMKRVLLKKEYEDMAKEGMKYKDIKVLLSQKYGLSVSTIEKLVYGQAKRQKTISSD
jgi:hypothetical protein